MNVNALPPALVPNGILYVASTTGRAIRLKGGQQLPSQGLTVVSQNPIYVQGDYNTINKVPAAIMGDAITVLSNNWGPNQSDLKGDQPFGNRPASPTTVNAAFMLVWRIVVQASWRAGTSGVQTVTLETMRAQGS